MVADPWPPARLGSDDRLPGSPAAAGVWLIAGPEGGCDSLSPRPALAPDGREGSSCVAPTGGVPRPWVVVTAAGGLGDGGGVRLPEGTGDRAAVLGDRGAPGSGWIPSAPEVAGAETRGGGAAWGD